MPSDLPAEKDIALIILHGLGVEGSAALPWLLARTGARLQVIDTVAKTGALPGPVCADPRVACCEEAGFTLPADPATALYLRSPGIPPVNPVFTAIREAGVAHTTPTGYWLARHAPAGTITVTGTKGKSSTVSLTANLLRWGGVAAEEMGNIGRTPFEAAPAEGAVCVMELSSYMMHDLPPADIFHVVTSLYKEHTDWHGSHEAYAADKLGPFLRTPPAPGLTTRELASRLGAVPDSLRFMEDVVPVRDDALDLGPAGSLAPGELNGAFRAPSMLLALRAAAAICLARGLLTAEQIREALELHLPGWAGLPSRQQRIETQDGRLWIDDALATVPEATLSALIRWQDRPVQLILGGKDRGQDFTGLVEACAARADVALFVFDETAAQIAALAGKARMGSRLTACDSLEKAIDAARQHSAAGDVILFSPAAPSSAQHGNYAVRSGIYRARAGGHG